MHATAAHQAEVSVQRAGLAGGLPSPSARTLKDLRFLVKAVWEDPQETAMAVATCGGMEAALRLGPKVLLSCTSLLLASSVSASMLPGSSGQGRSVQKMACNETLHAHTAFKPCPSP